jgi:ABC-2 type transport system ATP-binding protein
MVSQGDVLHVENLSYAYGERRAVRAASFNIRKGEIFGFLGPNGAGKTTTISCISGLLANWSGELEFAGKPFHPSRRTADRQKLGVVPQELALYEDLSARENLAFFAGLNGLSGTQRTQAVERALTMSGLEVRADDRVGQYSGGMKRRLNLAIGDLHEPELLLLDEPTAGVDPQSRNHIFDALTEIRRQGRTLLYTTHYMEEAQRLCDRVAVIHDGTVVALGTATELAEQAGVPGANLEQVFLELTGRSLRD